MAKKDGVPEGKNEVPEDNEENSKSKEEKELKNLIDTLSDDEISRLERMFSRDKYYVDSATYNFSDKCVKFGAFGDTHLNSKESNVEFLHKLYKNFEKEKVSFIIHTGDISEGEERRKGQKYDLLKQGIDETVDYIIETFPNVDIPTYFICGNHDEWYYNHAGIDIGRLVEERAKGKRRLHYLGMNEGWLPSKELGLGSTKIKLSHPSKGTAKGLSYQIQNEIEALGSNEKPNILFIGHYHKCDYLFYRNVHAFQTGTTQNATMFMRTKNLQANLSAWILHTYLNENGTVERIKRELFGV